MSKGIFFSCRHNLGPGLGVAGFVENALFKINRYMQPPKHILKNTNSTSRKYRSLAVVETTSIHWCCSSLGVHVILMFGKVLSVGAGKTATFNRALVRFYPFVHVHVILEGSCNTKTTYTDTGGEAIF